MLPNLLPHEGPFTRYLHNLLPYEGPHYMLPNLLPHEGNHYMLPNLLPHEGPHYTLPNLLPHGDSGEPLYITYLLIVCHMESIFSRPYLGHMEGPFTHYLI